MSGSLAQSIRLTEALINECTGIISKVEHIALTGQDPGLVWMHSHPANSEFVFGNRAVNHGDGVSTNSQRAFMKAVGESLERYCASFYQSDNMLFSAYKNLMVPATPPTAYALFLEDQYLYHNSNLDKFTEDTRVCWTMGTSLVDGSNKWAPAQFVYLPFVRRQNEAVLDNQISTGLACHTTLSKATAKSVLEILERDAFMLWWAFQRKASEIDISQFDQPMANEIFNELKRVGYDVHLLLIPSEMHVPIILAVVFSTDARLPITVVGLGSSAVVEEAILLSLEEVSLGLIGLSRSAQNHAELEPGADYANVRTLESHGVLYALDRVLSEELMRRVYSAKKIGQHDLHAVTDIREGKLMDNLIGGLAKRGFDLVVFDLTTPDVESAGFKVTRVLIPGMQPMDIDHNLQHLGGPRMTDLSTRYNSIQLPYRIPHPFP